MSEVVESAVGRFVAGEASVEAARALRGVAEAELLALVDRLLSERRRDHLEALGDSDLARAVRKAARKAAYKLESAGVPRTGSGRRAVVPMPEAATDLERAALTLPPGTYGRMWFILGSLPTAHAVEVRTEEQAELQVIERLPPTSTARLSKLVAGLAASDTPGLPFLCGLDLAARLLDGLADEVRRGGGRFPQEWTDVVLWREAAAAAGGDPERASARRGLQWRGGRPEAAALEATEGLINAPGAGPHVPPGRVIEAVVSEAVGMMQVGGEAPGREALYALADRHADRWLGQAGVRERVARLNALTADCAWARGDEETARGLLVVADALDAGERASRIGLLRLAFRRLVEDDVALAKYAAAQAEQGV